jgi:NADH dehydrogenase
VKILIAGCPALLRRSIVNPLVGAKHDLRVLADNDGAHDYERWPAQVEPWSVSDVAGLGQAASGCDLLISIDPALDEHWASSSDAEWTPRVDELAAVATRVAAKLLTVVPRSGSGANAAAERGNVSGFPNLPHLQLHTAPVYGTGTDPISLLLILMRSLPAVPTLSDRHVVQPLWHQDLGRAVAAGVVRDARGVERLDLAGPDSVTYDELYERLAALTNRRPVKIPVPDFLAVNAARLADAFHLPVPFAASHLAFLDQAGEPLPASNNALMTALGIEPTTLDAGLQCLIDELDALTPQQGVGGVEVKRFSDDIRNSAWDARGLLRQLRSRFNEVMPVAVGVEPAAPGVELVEGAVLTLALPGRGHVQIRVEEVTDEHVIVSTVRGHALAGIVRFRVEQLADVVRFEVLTCDTAASALDWLALTIGGSRIQDANWSAVVKNVVNLSGGTSEGVQFDRRKLEEGEAQLVDRWIKGVIQRQRESTTTHA